MPGHTSPRILCMEDDRAMARLLQKCLERDGYTVELAYDGAEGLEKCHAGGYDAIVVDYRMPQRNGLEVLRALAAEGRLPPAIVLTATGSEDVAVETLKLGAADYIVKDAQGEFLGRLSSALARVLELKRLETALTEQRELLTSILAGIPHSVFWKDRNSVYLGCNGNFVRDAELASPEEVAGKTDDDFVWKDRATMYRRCDEHVMRTGEPMLNVEESLWRGDREATVLTSKVALHNPAGDVIGVLGVYVDISDRKRAEQALHESEARFRTLVANMPGVVYRCRADHERTVEYISDQVEPLTGYRPGDFLGPPGRTLNSLIHAGDAATVQQRIRDALAGPHAYALEYRILRADGRVRWVIEQGQVVVDSTGEELWLDGIILDLTERRKAEDALTRRLEAERLINSVSAQFVGIESPQLEDSINGTLARIGDYLDADRVTAFLFAETTEQDHSVLQWCAAGVPSTVALCEAWPLEQFTAWMAVLRGGEAIHLPDFAGTPPEPTLERSIPEAHNVQSLLMMPTLVNGRLRGFVTVATVRQRSAWQEEDLAVVRVLSEILFGAVQRIEAKESLRRERDVAEALIDNAQTIVVLIDDQGRLVRCNRYTEKLTGYSFPEVQGKDAVDIFIPVQERERVRAIVQESLQGTSMHGTICPLVTKDGRLREIQWYEHVLRDERGQPASLLAVGHDITERRRTEQELEGKTQALELHVRQVNCLHAISRLLEDGDLTVPEILRQAVDLIPSAWQHSNVACARIMLDDLVFQSPNFTETLWRLAAPVFVEREFAGAVDVCYFEANGERPFLPEERELILDIGQRLGKVIERHRAQAKVRVLQQQIEYVLGATRTGLCITDVDGRLQYVDQAWQQVLGDPTGKRCHEYFKKSNGPCDDCSTAKALTTRQAVVTDETFPLEANRPVQVTTIPFQGEQGEWLIAKVHVDVSRLRRLERELSQSQRLEAIGQLAAGIAHEINTPTQYIGDNTRFLEDAFGSLAPLLTQMSQLIDAAKEGEVPGALLAEVEEAVREADLEFLITEIPKALHASLDGVDRVATIVRAMKEFSHPGGEQKQAVDLNRTIGSTVTVSRNEWKYVAELETDFDSQLPMVHCYPSELNQAILNVLINAGQAIGEAVGEGRNGKGKITVQTQRNGDWAEIRVADTGAGIPEPVRSTIFDPFFTTKEVGKGTGQGLAIAYHTIVEKHHGTIHFETQVGAGTTFIIRLPLTVTTKESADAHAQADRVARR